MLRAALLAVVGLGSLAAVYAALAPDAPRREPAQASGSPGAAGADAAEFRPAADPAIAPAADPPAGDDRRAVRDVTPSGMTAGPVVTGPLVRIEPPPPPAEPEPVKPARLQRLPKPVIAAAGLLVSGKREVRLAGIEAPGPEATCGEGAAAWPCGRMARAALRRFVRGRAVQCEVPAGADAIPDAARCQVAKADLSEWLVAQGWAKRAGDSYAESEAAAREARRGVWSDRRPDAQPDFAAARASVSAPASALSISDLVSGMP